MKDYLKEVNEKTYNEILPIIKEIRNHLICNSCGGSKYHDATCMYCNNINKELEEYLTKLNDILNKYSENIISTNTKDMPINDLFNLLSSIGNLESETINNLLEKYNYKEKYIKVRDNVFYQINMFDTHLTDLDLSIIENELFNQSTTLDIGKAFTFFVRNALAKHQNIKYEAFCELIRRYAILEMESFHFKGICEIVEDAGKREDEHDRQLGSQVFNKITLSDIGIKKLYNGDSFYVLITIYHELTHVLQFKNTVHKEIGMIEEIKDEILANHIDNYYRDNYNKVFFEIEARYHGLIHAIEVLESKMAIKVKKEGYVENELKYLQDHMYDKKRIINGAESHLDIIFAEFIKDKPELFQRYPQLHILYKIIDNEVFPKTPDELLSDYEVIMNNRNYSEQEKKIYELIISGYVRLDEQLKK